MATDKQNAQDPVRDFLAESDKLIKLTDKNLKKIDAMRKEIGLKAGASQELLSGIGPEQEQHQLAHKELQRFLKENELELVAAPEKKQKKRKKLNNAMRKNLRI